MKGLRAIGARAEERDDGDDPEGEPRPILLYDCPGQDQAKRDQQCRPGVVRDLVVVVMAVAHGQHLA